MLNHKIILHFDNMYYEINTIAQSIEKAINNAKFRLTKYLTRFGKYANIVSTRIAVSKYAKVILNLNSSIKPLIIGD